MGLFFGLFLAIIPNVLWLFGALVGRLSGCRLPYAPFGWTAAGLVTALWLCLLYGSLVGRLRHVVTDVTFSSRDLPTQFDGYRIVHISDLHVDSFSGNPKALQRMIDAVNAQGADAILFTGDIVTGSMDGVLQFEETLSRLHAVDGVMSVLGNHDFFIYDRGYRSDGERRAAADSLSRFESERLGWTVLRNRNVIIERGGAAIAVAGVDNINGGQGFHTIQMGDLGKALEGTDGMFTVLLSHDPSHWRGEVLSKSDVQLTLSGHTHAAQVRVFGQSLAKLMFKECDGAYMEDGRMLYVTAGIGCTAPVRFSCPAEITVMTLRSTRL